MNEVTTMVWISETQKTTMSMIDEIVEEFGQDRWFVQAELPGITLHTMNALVDKGYLEEKLIGKYDMLYYRRIKKMGEHG
jgi:hypothetical protein